MRYRMQNTTDPHLRSRYMKHLKKLIALCASGALLTCQTADAELYATNTGGCGYEECRQTPCLTPAIALGTIALVAIVAVALQESHGAHGHCH
jgi:hypothetical protein